MNKYTIAGLSTVLFPYLAEAQVVYGTSGGNRNLSWLMGLIVSYLQSFLVLLIGAAVVIFVYNVVRYFILPNDDRKTAGTYVMYSVIGFFVILSFWGLVNILQNTFKLHNEVNRPSTWRSFMNLFPGNGSVNSNFNTSGYPSSYDPSYPYWQAGAGGSVGY